MAARLPVCLARSYRPRRSVDSSVSGVLTDPPFNDAMSSTVCVTDTNPERTGNAAVDALVGMFTEPSVINAPLLEDSATVTPPEGAASVRVTVQNETLREAIVDGEHVTLDTVAVAVALAVTDRVVVAVVPFREAVNVAD
jgi:hypothetical protein